MTFHAKSISRATTDSTHKFEDLAPLPRSETVIYQHPRAHPQGVIPDRQWTL